MGSIAGFGKACELIDYKDAVKASEIKNYLLENLTKIDGTVYTLEIAEEVGFLYDNSGKLYAIISDDTTVKVNAFTKEIPSSVFDIPSDYEIIDMDALAQ